MELAAVLRRFGDLDISTRYIMRKTANSVTYDHRILKPALPVRSAVLKQDTGALVLGWVTTGEYALLYVFVKKTVFFWSRQRGFSAPKLPRFRPMAWQPTTARVTQPRQALR